MRFSLHFVQGDPELIVKIMQNKLKTLCLQFYGWVILVYATAQS